MRPTDLAERVLKSPWLAFTVAGLLLTTSMIALWKQAEARAEEGVRIKQGPAGPPGPVGPPGPQGNTGTTGQDGHNGHNGPPGPKGNKGNTGNTGATGKTGATGPQGKQGVRGVRGAPGPLCPPGFSAQTLTVRLQGSNMAQIHVCVG